MTSLAMFGALGVPSVLPCLLGTAVGVAPPVMIPPGAPAAALPYGYSSALPAGTSALRRVAPIGSASSLPRFAPRLRGQTALTAQLNSDAGGQLQEALGGIPPRGSPAVIALDTRAEAELSPATSERSAPLGVHREQWDEQFLDVTNSLSIRSWKALLGVMPIQAWSTLLSVVALTVLAVAMIWKGRCRQEPCIFSEVEAATELAVRRNQDADDLLQKVGFSRSGQPTLAVACVASEKIKEGTLQSPVKREVGFVYPAPVALPADRAESSTARGRQCGRAAFGRADLTIGLLGWRLPSRATVAASRDVGVAMRVSRSARRFVSSRSLIKRKPRPLPTDDDADASTAASELDRWAERGAVPWSTDLAMAWDDGQAQDMAPYAPGGSVQEARKSQLAEDDDSYAFWNEQERPTPGPGNLPRLREARPLPEPLPSLVPPVAAAMSDDDRRDFKESYGRYPPTIMDVDGEPVEVLDIENYEEAAQKFKFPDFLRASLAEEKFWNLTPVQTCTMPLMLEHKDFLATSFTGSGKTAAYMLPLLTSISFMSRCEPNAPVAAHFRTRGGAKSVKPQLGTVRGRRLGSVGVEFEAENGKVHRQFVPPEWVVSAGRPGPLKRWKGPAMPFAIVLVPTRELCDQVQKEFTKFLGFTRLRSVGIHGSRDLRSQLRDLAHGADVLVCTPGRLIDVLHRGVCKLARVRHLVLDEVDRMMDMGFGGQLQEIMEQGGMPATAEGRQTSFWSATIPDYVKKVIEAFLGKPCLWADCTGGRVNAIAKTIHHWLIDARPPHRAMRDFEPGNQVICKGGRRGVVDLVLKRKIRVTFTDLDVVQKKLLKKGRVHLASWKTDGIKRERLATLRDVLKHDEFQDAKVIVFCRKRETVSEVYQFLDSCFEGVVLCHGGMSQAMRKRSVQKLRDGSVDILVATDVAARGLDIEDVSHVVNYELPLNLDEFVHRCGRTGRIGRQGAAVTFVTGREWIFKGLRRVLRWQMGRVPDWFSLEGMDNAWRPSNWKLPFETSSGVVKRVASFRERRERMVEKQTKLRAKLQYAARAMEQNVVRGADYQARESRRRWLQERRGEKLTLPEEQELALEAARDEAEALETEELIAI